MKIGILSDTHGHLDDRVLHHLHGCHVLHAGDIGSLEVWEKLSAEFTCTGVWGNIDGTALRSRLSEYELLELGGVRILLIHIAGQVGTYNAQVRTLIQKHSPTVLVCGHSHLLKVQHDVRFNLLYINPGAAGRYGIHKKRTLIRLDAAHGKLSNLEVVELGPRSADTVG